MSQLERAIDDLADDWVNVSTLVDVKLIALRIVSQKEQCRGLQELADAFSATERKSIVSAIAWDVIAPLLFFLNNPSTRTHAQQLLNIAVQQGNSKEVLLKLIEASENLSRYAEEEDWAQDPDIGIQMILLRAQDHILRKITTARPSRFLAEYTKCILTVMSQVADTFDRSEMVIFWTDHLQESLSIGAIRHMKIQAKTEQEVSSTSTLLKSFHTYVAEHIGQQPKQLCSYELFQSLHPELKLPSTGIEQVDTDQDSGPGILDNLSEIFTESDLMELFACGSWAALENTEEDDGYVNTSDQESDTGLDTSDIPFSPPGSAMLLAHYLRKMCLQAQPQGTTTLDVQSITRLESCMTIIVELCIRRSPHPAILDACLYITYLVISHVNLHEVFQSLSESCSSINSALGDLQLSSFAYNRFVLFMQGLSYISASCRHPQLRMISHYMVRDVLWRSTDEFALKWFMDTFQNCPFDSLRTASVGLFKDFLVCRPTLMWSCLQPLESVDKSPDRTASQHKPMDKTKSSIGAFSSQTISILNEILRPDELRIGFDHNQAVHAIPEVQSDDEVKASGLWLQSSNLIIFLLIHAAAPQALKRTSNDQRHRSRAAVPAETPELGYTTPLSAIATDSGASDFTSLVRQWVSLITARIAPRRTSVEPMTRDILNMSLSRITQLMETS